MDWTAALSNRHFEAAMSAVGGFAFPFFLSLVKHAPAPKAASLWLGAIFDAVQDTAKNPERIGQRRGSDSTFVTATDTSGKTATVKSVTESHT